MLLLLRTSFHQLPHSILISLLGITSLSATEPTAGEKLFALKIHPLFAERCFSCHGAEGKKGKKTKGGFDMNSRESLLLGGDEYAGEVLISGKGE